MTGISAPVAASLIAVAQSKAGAIAAAVIGTLAGLAFVSFVFTHVNEKGKGKETEKEKEKKTEKEQIDRKESANGNGKVQAPNTWLRLMKEKEGDNGSERKRVRAGKMNEVFL